jgi:hypothetical protein
MNKAPKPRGMAMFSISGVPLPWRMIFVGQTSGLAAKIQGLLREQIQLLETGHVLSVAALQTYEVRAKQISELIELLTED